jgi:hypothetical protein
MGIFGEMEKENLKFYKKHLKYSMNYNIIAFALSE